jgi:exonuclease VII small subunit
MRLPPNLNFNQRRRLVEALIACSCLSDPRSRDQVINGLPVEVRPRINRYPSDLQDVDSIVCTCLSFEAALQEFFEVVHFHEGDSIHWRRLELIISELEQGIDPIDSASRAHRLHHRCNRSPQRDSFEMAFDRHRESRARRPLVCLAPK